MLVKSAARPVSQRWGGTWGAGVPVTFAHIVQRHLRQGSRDTGDISPDSLLSCKSKRFVCSLGDDFQLGEIKGKVQFSLYLLFIFALLPHINFATCHLPLKKS